MKKSFFIFLIPFLLIEIDNIKGSSQGFFDCINFFNVQPYKCPSIEYTNIRCWSQSLAIGSTSSGDASFNNDSLVIMPSTELRCVIECRNSRNGSPAAGQCIPRYFKNEDNKTLGDLQPFQIGSEENTLNFRYKAPSYTNKLADGGNDSFRIKLMDKGLIKNTEKLNIIFPRKISTKSSLNCNMNYVKQQDVVVCHIIPRDDTKQVIEGAPMMFNILLAEGNDEEVGNFSPNTYLTSDNDGKKMTFEYKAGTKRGSNTIIAKFSNSLPSILPKNKELTPGNWTITTVSTEKRFKDSKGFYGLIFIVIAIAHTLFALK